MKNENKDPAFAALNPNAKVPAIYDPKGPTGEPVALFESGAILHLPRRRQDRLAAAAGGGPRRATRRSRG